MKGKMARAAAAALALLLALGYWLLPGVEEREIPSNSGHQKHTLEDGDSVSWPWTPTMEGSSELTVSLKGLKKAQGMTLTASLTDGAGTEAASVVRPVQELGEEGGLSLKGSFRTGTAYTLTIRAEGEGKISIPGEEEEDGTFRPSLKETGTVISRNPVLLYFALGLALLALTPVTGPDGELRKSAGKQDLTARLLPWGTFLLILGAGLLVDLKKPTFFTDPTWGTWDEDNHSYWVQSMALISGGGLRNCLNSVITWHPGYLPLGLGYNLGELLNLAGWKDPDLPYRAAVVTGTAVYAGMCALAVKRAPKYKVTFFAAATIPMMIFQATSMTYDTAVTGSVLLGTALLLETLERPGRLSAARAVTLASLLALGTVAKPAYSAVLLGLLLIPAEKFGSRREKWAFRAFTVLLVCWCAAAMVMPGAYEDVMSGDLRFSDTDAGAQIQGMLADPFGSGLKPVRYFFENLSFLTAEWLDFWAYVKFGFPNLREMYILMLLIVAPLCVCGEDPEEKSPLTAGRRVSLGLTVFLAEALLIYAQYIASSPVGGNVTGMQPRYFTPLWAPALLALMWPREIRERARPAGNVLTWTAFLICGWANIENALIHLRDFGLN